MSLSLQHRDVPARHERRRKDEFNDWTEPLGSSSDEMQKAYLEICGWLNRVNVSTAKRARSDSLRRS